MVDCVAVAGAAVAVPLLRRLGARGPVVEHPGRQGGTSAQERAHRTSRLRIEDHLCDEPVLGQQFVVFESAAAVGSVGVSADEFIHPLIGLRRDDAFEDQVAPLTEFEDLGVRQGGRDIGQAQGHQLHLSRMNSQPSP